MAKNKTTNGKELTLLEQETVKAIRKVKEYKLSCEANIVSIFYSNYELLYAYENLKLADFNHNVWKVYFIIAYSIIIKEKKQSLDEITVGLYLEKHSKLKEKYDAYGGYETIEKAKEYIKEENLQGYIDELHKWNAVLQLLRVGFPIYDKLSEFADMTAQQIYDYYEANLNHIFVNVDNDVKSYNLCEGIHDLIDKLNEGYNIGLPLHESPILNKEIAGNKRGHITLFGALSGAGKTTTTIQWIFPSILKNDEKLCMIINEEDESKIRQELIVWVANNIFKEDFQKYKLRDGKFTPETMELLKKCADWIEEKKESRHITIIPLEHYTTDIAIKIIKKYISVGGVKYFILDTLKANADSTTDMVWLEMQKDMVKLYDVIKPSQKNVHLWATYQLGKEATKKRYYTNQEIGMSRSIVDVASTNLMIRQPFEDEFEGEKHELKCYRLEGRNKLTRIPFKLDKNKDYIIIFITKNRFGTTQRFQIIAENDFSRNIYKEVGITNIIPDW